MANDLATLRSRLSVALRDPGMATWASAELDNILNSAAAQLYPRVAIPISLPIYPISSADTEDYALPTGILEISRVDLAEVATDLLLMPLPGGTWEIYGDPLSGTAKLFVNRHYVNEDRYLIVHGYGSYNLTTGIPDIYVPFVMATARAEAWKAMISDRARFTEWLTLNQKENVSVNEIAQMISVAENEAERHRARMKTWRKPKPARL